MPNEIGEKHNQNRGHLKQWKWKKKREIERKQATWNIAVLWLKWQINFLNSLNKRHKYCGSSTNISHASTWCMMMPGWMHSLRQRRQQARQAFYIILLMALLQVCCFFAFFVLANNYSNLTIIMWAAEVNECLSAWELRLVASTSSSPTTCCCRVPQYRLVAVIVLHHRHRSPHLRLWWWHIYFLTAFLSPVALATKHCQFTS